MAITNFFGPGVGLIDKGLVDANFAAVSSGSSSSPINNVVAHAGGGQASATVLAGSTLFRVTTVATAGDSVQLPLAASQRVVVLNKGANSMNIFALNGSADTINGTAGSTAYALAAGKAAEFLSSAATLWDVLLSA